MISGCAGGDAMVVSTGTMSVWPFETAVWRVTRTAERLELLGEDALQGLGIGAAVVDGGGRGQLELVVSESAAAAPWMASECAVRR
jgi:hypothetical protein